MNIVGKVSAKPPAAVVNELGLGRGGDVQRFHTLNTMRRIQKYVPYLTGTTIMLMITDSPLEEPQLNFDVPYARYLYYGKAMVDAQTGKGPALNPNVGYRFRKGAVLRATNRDLNYTKTFNPKAGPFWDRRLVAAEGSVMQEELQKYVDRRPK